MYVRHRKERSKSYAFIIEAFTNKIESRTGSIALAQNTCLMTMTAILIQKELQLELSYVICKVTFVFVAITGHRSSFKKKIKRCSYQTKRFGFPVSYSYISPPGVVATFQQNHPPGCCHAISARCDFQSVNCMYVNYIFVTSYIIYLNDNRELAIKSLQRFSHRDVTLT